eukprot:SAG11_NODE_1634_length_4542_cov_2.175332_1_plen_484_part_00
MSSQPPSSVSPQGDEHITTMLSVLKARMAHVDTIISASASLIDSSDDSASDENAPTTHRGEVPSETPPGAEGEPQAEDEAEATPAEVKELQEKMKVMQFQNFSLQAQLADLRELSSDEMEAFKKKTMNFMAKLKDRHEMEMADLTDGDDVAAGLAKQLSDANAARDTEVNALQDELVKTKKNADDDLTAANQKHEKEMDELQAVVKRFKAEAEKSKADVATMKKRLLAARDAMKAKIDDYETRTAEQADRIMELEKIAVEAAEKSARAAAEETHEKARREAEASAASAAEHASRADHERAAREEAEASGIMIGLLQGLRYQQTRRVDLSAAPITAPQLAQIGTSCPDLDAIFFHRNHPPPEPALLALKQACPNLRCGMLGREISAATFESLVARLGESELDLCGTPYAALSDDGLHEIGVLFPNLRAICCNATAVSDEGRLALRQICPHLECCLLGKALSADEFGALQHGYDRSKTLDFQLLG